MSKLNELTSIINSDDFKILYNLKNEKAQALIDTALNYNFANFSVKENVLISADNKKVLSIYIEYNRRNELTNFAIALYVNADNCKSIKIHEDIHCNKHESVYIADKTYYRASYIYINNGNVDVYTDRPFYQRTRVHNRKLCDSFFEIARYSDLHANALHQELYLNYAYLLQSHTKSANITAMCEYLVALASTEYVDRKKQSATA